MNKTHLHGWALLCAKPLLLASLALPAAVAHAAPDLSKSQALQRLQGLADGKVNKAQLAQWLDQGTNDLIVEFEPDTALASASDAEEDESAMAVRRHAYRAAKQAVARVMVVGEHSTVQDFDNLPMALVRTRSRTALAKLLEHRLIKGVYPNAAHYTSLTQSLPLINHATAMSLSTQGEGSTVAVLDTGLDYRRSPFGCTAPGVPSACKVAHAFDAAPTDGVLDDASSMHGTNVAGVVLGVAPKARVIGIDVFNGNRAYVSDILNGINWAIKNKSRYNIVALNLSLGMGVRQTTECKGSWASTPFANARAAGILPVVAAGNEGFSDGVSEPACAPGAVRVGAVYDTAMGQVGWGLCTDVATAPDLVTCFSNGGPLLSLLAPGALINAAGITQGGTSQAAPHVAGAIAVLRAPRMPAPESISNTVLRLRSHGRPVTDPRTGLVAPRLDLGAAVTSQVQLRPASGSTP